MKKKAEGLRDRLEKSGRVTNGWREAMCKQKAVGKEKCEMTKQRPSSPRAAREGSDRLSVVCRGASDVDLLKETRLDLVTSHG